MQEVLVDLWKVPNWFTSQKRSGDYYDEMDSQRFEDWLKVKLLPNINEGSVVLMDNATYHSRKKEKIPTPSSHKMEIKTWLKSKEIELLGLINSVRDKYTSYEVDEMAKEKDILCRIPPYHCELNAIELVWSQLKRDIASHNVSFRPKMCRH
ncbi:hypothetical protein J437_LFUL016316 [Ladona fulva]|uniref:Tc1-like transposase DDE domain-containing protein n=1 Tax=Ladona fulva TaxID=123851 RepID=A0A8K0KQI1_LADFU|nr:hypothetical protein J437_LFUL016316 [Ladona fulva]